MNAIGGRRHSRGRMKDYVDASRRLEERGQVEDVSRGELDFLPVKPRVAVPPSLRPNDNRLADEGADFPS